jgi:hypothetical protein
LNFSAQLLVYVFGSCIPSIYRLTICDQLESFPPEDNALLHVQSNTLEEKRVLQSALMLQVTVLPQLAVQVLHTKREVRAQSVNTASVNVGDVTDSAIIGVGCVRCDE